MLHSWRHYYRWPATGYWSVMVNNLWRWWISLATSTWLSLLFSIHSNSLALVSDYRIEAVTSSDQKASVARLQMFIEVHIPYSTGGVGTARILAEQTLAAGRDKAHSIFKLTRPDNFLGNKTLADWQLTTKSAEVFSCQSFMLYSITVPINSNCVYV